MNKIIHNPHLVFFLSIPFIILIGLLNGKNEIVINVHDTYFVIFPNDLSILISILFVMIGFGYWIILKTKNKLYKWLSLIHIAVTFGGILLILIFSQFFRESILEHDYNYKLTLAIYFITLIVILGQLIYLFNIISGIMGKRN